MSDNSSFSADFFKEMGADGKDIIFSSTETLPNGFEVDKDTQLKFGGKQEKDEIQIGHIEQVEFVNTDKIEDLNKQKELLLKGDITPTEEEISLIQQREQLLKGNEDVAYKIVELEKQKNQDLPEIDNIDREIIKLNTLKKNLEKASPENKERLEKLNYDVGILQHATGVNTLYGYKIDKNALSEEQKKAIENDKGFKEKDGQLYYVPNFVRKNKKYPTTGKFENQGKSRELYNSALGEFAKHLVQAGIFEHKFIENANFAANAVAYAHKDLKAKVQDKNGNIRSDSYVIIHGNGVDSLGRSGVYFKKLRAELNENYLSQVKGNSKEQNEIQSRIEELEKKRDGLKNSVNETIKTINELKDGKENEDKITKINEKISKIQRGAIEEKDKKLLEIEEEIKKLEATNKQINSIPVYAKLKANEKKHDLKEPSNDKDDFFVGRPVVSKDALDKNKKVTAFYLKSQEQNNEKVEKELKEAYGKDKNSMETKTAEAKRDIQQSKDHKTRSVIEFDSTKPGELAITYDRDAMKEQMGNKNLALYADLDPNFQMNMPIGRDGNPSTPITFSVKNPDGSTRPVETPEEFAEVEKALKNKKALTLGGKDANGSVGKPIDLKEAAFESLKKQQGLEYDEKPITKVDKGIAEIDAKTTQRSPEAKKVEDLALAARAELLKKEAEQKKPQLGALGQIANGEGQSQSPILSGQKPQEQGMTK